MDYKKLQQIIKQSALLLTFFWTLGLTSLCAQDKKLDIDIGINKEPVWYQQPWAWIVGAAVFILLLVALLRAGKKK